MSTNLNLRHTIVCEDVRIEITRNLSLMGVLHLLHVPQTPVTLFKLAVVNHWRGVGRYRTQVQILTPDRSRSIVVSQASTIDVPEDGGADNVTVFTNVTFPEPGQYVVQTLIDSSLFAETMLPVVVAQQQSSVQAAFDTGPDDVIN
ncbi:MAG: hypothetical protein IPF53_13190 [Blastocatellia bacterium]|nr:hypothetical protein [Blastocatellia bacterium]MBK6425782.1 hypothetical protein [Blastocatellia bacterium]